MARAMPHIRRVLSGCAYAHPLPDDPRIPRKPPDDVDPEQLRAWQLRDICALDAVGCPIDISHEASGTLYDAASHTYEPDKSPMGGAIRLGVVTRAWINPATGALHWAGVIQYTPDTFLADTLLYADRVYPDCSMFYHRHVPPAQPRAKLFKISIVHAGRWPNTRINWSEPVIDYMRKTGYTHCIPRTQPPLFVMASAQPAADAPQQPPPVATPTATPAAAPVQQQQQQQQPRDPDGRYTFSRTPQAQSVPELTEAQAKDFEAAAAIESAPPIVSEAFAKLIEERDVLRAKAAKHDQIIQENNERTATVRREVLKTLVNFMAQHQNPALTEHINSLAPALSVAASNASNSDVNALWNFTEAIARSVSVPTTQQPVQPVSLMTSRQGVRPGDAIPSPRQTKRPNTSYNIFNSATTPDQTVRMPPPPQASYPPQSTSYYHVQEQLQPQPNMVLASAAPPGRSEAVIAMARALSEYTHGGNVMPYKALIGVDGGAISDRDRMRMVGTYDPDTAPRRM